MALIPVKLPNGDELKLTAGGQISCQAHHRRVMSTLSPGGIIFTWMNAGPNEGNPLEYLKDSWALR